MTILEAEIIPSYESTKHEALIRSHHYQRPNCDYCAICNFHYTCHVAEIKNGHAFKLQKLGLCTQCGNESEYHTMR